MTEYPTEPPDDPQDHFCKRVCGRIAGGLIHDTPLKDLRELKRWLDDHIEHRDALPVSASFKPF